VGSREGDEALASNVAARVPAALAFTGTRVRESVLTGAADPSVVNGPLQPDTAPATAAPGPGPAGVGGNGAGGG
jgi:hypothetical protein